MKFLTIFAALASLSSVVLGDYCGHDCDPSLIPSKTLKAPITVVDTKYSVTGTFYINNDCEFTIEDFSVTPKTSNAKWYGTNSFESTTGILLSNEIVGEVTSPKSLTYSIKDTSLFCKASLVNDIGENGVFRLLDDNNQLIAYAKVQASDEKPVVASSSTTTTTSTKKSTTSNSTKKSTTSTSTKKTSTTDETSTTSTSTKKKTTTTTSKSKSSSTSTKLSDKIDSSDATTTTTTAQDDAAASPTDVTSPIDSGVLTDGSVNSGNATDSSITGIATNPGNDTNSINVANANPTTTTLKISLSATNVNDQSSGAQTLSVSYVIYLALFIFTLYIRY